MFRALYYGQKEIRKNPPHITPGPKEAQASCDMGLFFITPEIIAILIDGAFLKNKLLI